MHSEPIELFHMMYANGLCRGCADLYKAWSHYHEAAEDFQGANNILELGKKAMAQPYEELEMAYQNLLMAVGQYVSLFLLLLLLSVTISITSIT